MRGPDEDLEQWLAAQRQQLGLGPRKGTPAGAAQGSRAAWTLASIADAVVRTDGAGRIDYLNPAAEELLGLAAAAALGKQLPEVVTFLAEPNRQPLPDPAARCLEQQAPAGTEAQVVVVPAGSREFPACFSIAPLRDAQGNLQGTVLVLRDVAQILQRESQISYLASHDPLTGLLNRRHFEHLLDETLHDTSLASGRRHFLSYLDLDEFKRINDAGGHLAGDEMLRQVTSLLAGTVRSCDVLARLGGDEFGAVLRDCRFDEALEVADTMREAVKSFGFHWESRVFHVGVSIGLVPIAPGVAREQLLRAADSACYAAKEKGRNRIEILQPEDVELPSRSGDSLWTGRLQSALQENRFQLHWQPVEPLGDGAPGGLRGEVLLRLLEGGELLPPAAFLPAAERCRLLAAVDRWVVKATLRLIAQRGWSAGGCLAINLSAQSLAEGGFEDFVLKVIRGSTVPPERLCFELAETAVLANLAAAQRLCGALHRAGCRLSLDDFGSSLSSCTYLRTLPLDYLKIHGDFVRTADADPVSRAIVESAHRIAAALGIETVGKCVESEALRQLLSELGVDYAQGYGVAPVRPLEAQLAAPRPQLAIE